MEKWLYYLKNIQDMNENDLQREQDPVFRRMMELCKYSNLNDMEQEEYKQSLLDYEGVRDAVECAREDGREEGMEKGLELGREEGREDEKRSIAKKMLSLGVDMSTIRATTGLTEEEIKML